MPDDKKPNVFTDGTDSSSTDPRSQAQKDADAKKGLKERKKATKALEQKNTKGKITTVSPPGKTPEKSTTMEKIQKEIKEAQEGLKESLGLNKGTDKLGAGQAAKDGIDSARPGGYEIKVGVTGKGTTPIPGVDPIKIGKPDNIYGTKGGVPCDTDAGEIGVGSSYISKWLSMLKYAKKAEKLGAKVEGNVGVSVKADVACINPEAAGKAGLGAIVHGVENSDPAQTVHWENQKARLDAAEKAALGE